MLRVMRSRPNEADVSPSYREPRRNVDLAGFGIFAEGKTFSLSVLNLSYDGCQIATELALLPGTNLRISILGLGRASDAIVRWYKDGFAGLEFAPEEECEASQIPRKYERVDLTAQLMLRRHGRQYYLASLFDLTPKGCRVEFIERPKCGEMMWVKLDTFDSIEARVKWVDGFYGGLEFVRPIYPAVFDILLARLRH